MIRRPLGEGEGDWEEHLRIPEAGMMEVLIDVSIFRAINLRPHLSHFRAESWLFLYI
jgi:hypothetical protein